MPRARLFQIIVRPAKLIGQRCKEQCAVCSTSGNDHICSVAQTLFDSLMSDVSVTVINLIQNRMEISVIVKIRECPSVLEQLWDLVLNRIARDISDLISLHLFRLGPLPDAVYTACNIHTTCICTDTDVFLPRFLAGLFRNFLSESPVQSLLSDPSAAALP